VKAKRSDAAAIEALVLTIPGNPVAQGRPRFSVRGGFARVYDPAKSRSWKGAAWVVIRAAMRAQGFARIDTGPVSLDLLAVFARPKSKCSTRSPRPRERRPQAPDWDNVGKIFCDAANTLIWSDDAQVTDARVSKRIAAQGEAPFLSVTVRAIPASESV